MYFLDVRKVRKKRKKRSLDYWTCTEARECLFFEVQLLRWKNRTQQVRARALCGGEAARQDGAAGGPRAPGARAGSAPVWSCGRTAPGAAALRHGCSAPGAAGSALSVTGNHGFANLHHGKRWLLLSYNTGNHIWTPNPKCVALDFSAQED